MPNCCSKVNCAKKSKGLSLGENRRKLYEKLKRDKAVMEECIADQTKEFECERKLTEKRLKMWMDPDNCTAFDRRLRRLTQREAKALERRLSCKLNSIKTERRFLQSRLVWFRKLDECVNKKDGANMDDLLKDMGCKTHCGRINKKKKRIPCGVR